MIIDCVSDLHGHYPKLEGGDLLIVAGDLTARDLENEHALFDYWLNEQNYQKKIVIAGNHDNVLKEERLKLQFGEYLCDSGTEFECLKIWGSPWSKTFAGMNSHCKAFTVDTEEELASKFSLIPQDTDILITHSPPYGHLDENVDRKNCGSKSLQFALSRIQTKVHIFGHIHEAYGKIDKVFIRLHPKHKIKRSHISINASHVNSCYEPVNKPIRIEL